MKISRGCGAASGEAKVHCADGRAGETGRYQEGRGSGLSAFSGLFVLGSTFLTEEEFYILDIFVVERRAWTGLSQLLANAMFSIICLGLFEVSSSFDRRLINSWYDKADGRLSEYHAGNMTDSQAFSYFEDHGV